MSSTKTCLACILCQPISSYSFSLSPPKRKPSIFPGCITKPDGCWSHTANPGVGKQSTGRDRRLPAHCYLTSPSSWKTRQGSYLSCGADWGRRKTQGMNLFYSSSNYFRSGVMHSIWISEIIRYHHMSDSKVQIISSLYLFLFQELQNFTEQEET